MVNHTRPPPQEGRRAGGRRWLCNPSFSWAERTTYMVDRDGKIHQLVGDSKRAWHAGKSELHGVPTDVNGRSIGIEIVNDGSGKTDPASNCDWKRLRNAID